MNKILQLATIFLSLLTSGYLHAQCNAKAGQDAIICNGASTVIGGNSTGAPTITYSWSPATGLSATNVANPTANPTSTTIYTLTITDGNGCTDTDQMTVAVTPTPNSAFSFLPNNVCATTPIAFSANTVVGGYTYSWNFGNPASGSSNTANGPNATHTFVSNGPTSQIFTVTLTVTSNFGCQSITTQNVTIQSLPDAQLTDPINSFKNCDGTNFNMTVYDMTPNPGQNYEIIWGDGSPNYTSTTAPTAGESHLYTTADIFDMYYVVTGMNGCADTTHYIVSNITNPAIGAANPGATTGCGPLTLCFPLSNYTANHPSTIYIIDYGDGTPNDTIPHNALPPQICHTYTTSSCAASGGAFTFTIKAVNQCDISIATINPIRVYTAPQPAFTNPPIACVNTPVQFLNNTIPGFNAACSNTTLYKWDFGDGVVTGFSPVMSNPTHTYLLPGNYNVVLTVQNGCGTLTDTNTICIEIAPVPNYVINPDTACVPFNSLVNNLSDTSQICDYTLAWQMINYQTTCPATQNWTYANGTTSTDWEPEFTFSSAGQYIMRLNLTNTCGTFFKDDTVFAQDVPQINLPPLGPLCQGESVSPIVTVIDCYAPTTSILWDFTGANPSSSTSLIPGAILYANAGSYNINVDVTNVCGTVTQTQPLIVNIPPIADAGPDATFCSGGSTNIGSNPLPGVTYSWNPTTNLSSSTQSLVSANPTNAGSTPLIIDYVQTASTSPTCFSTDTVKITVNPIPVLNVNGGTICVGQSINLNVSGAGVGGTYSWTPATGLSCTNCDNPTANPTSTTVYTITGTNQFGCTSTIVSTVNVNPLPVVDAGPDQLFCDQPIPTTLVGSPAGGTWSGSPNITAVGVFTPNGIEVVNVTYTYTDGVTGCVNSDQAQITVQAPTIPTFNPTPSVCINNGVVDLNTVFAPNPLGGTWSGTGVTGTSFNPVTAGVGTHQMTYSYGAGACLVVQNVDIIVNPEPVLNVNGGTICVGQSINLNVSGAGGTYSWTPATGLSCTNCDNPTANPTTTTVYTITGTNQFGCTSTIVSTVNVNPLPVVDAGPDQLFCDQPIPTTLVGSPAGGTWSGSPNITAVGVFTPNGIEVVNVTYTYTDGVTGCVNSDQAQITVQAPTIPTFNPTPSVCINNGMVDLNTVFAPNPLGGTWSGTGVTGTSFNPVTAGVGTHQMTYSYGAGACLVVQNVDIIVNPEPVLNVNGGTICVGQSINLNVSGAGVGGTYSWTPATGLSCTNCDNPTANPTSTTVYTITGTNQFGCTSTIVSTVNVNPLPIVNAGNDTTICNQPIAVQFNATPNGGIWSGSGVNASGLFTPSVSGTFPLTYTYTDPVTMCTNSDVKNIIVVDPVNANAGPDLVQCTDNTTIQINGTPIGGSWSGLNITSGGIFSLANSGVFDLVYTYGAGNCLTTDTMQFTVNPLPVVNAGPDDEVCVSENSFNLNALPIGGTYSGNGITNTTLGTFDPLVATVGTHTITYTYTDPVTGCINADDLIIEVRPLPVVDFTSDPIVCMNVAVPFTNNSTLLDQSSWDFGDGGTSNVHNPTYTYTTSGTFNVQLIVTTQYGCVDSITKPIDVYVPPTVSFTVSPDSLCGPLVANFTNNSSGPSLSYFWDFGNGSTSTVQNPPSVTYFASNISDTTYTIELTVSNYCGQFTTQEDVIVMPNPTAVFDTDLDDFCSPWTPNFVNTSLGLPDTYTWDFGNGQTSNTNDSLFQIPTYTAGLSDTTYTIMLAVANECGVDTAYHTITVHPNTVNAFFNTNVTQGCMPLSVDFTQYTLGGTNYQWDFGDGNVSTSYSPTHVFTQAGTYQVSLIADNACSYDTTTVTINVFPSPVVDFIHQPDSVCVFSDFQFINQSVALVNNTWDFGDGTNSNLTNPTHSYSTAGNFTVTLTGVSANGCTSVATEIIHVNTPPVANFTLTPSSGCVALDVDFSNQSTNYTYSYWDFGDGNTSVASNPSHLYTTPGVYTVKLIVQNVNGCSDTLAQFVNVNPVPVADFSYVPTGTICGPNINAQFTNLSTGAVGYQWDFGDGGVSNLTNPPAYNYATAGTFTIQLIASNQFGCTDTATQQITIHQTPVANFSLNSNLGCQNTSIPFSSSSLFADSIVWTFGDGSNGLGFNVTHEYANVGNYNVSIVAYGSGGCTDTFNLATPINIQTSPVADFSYETTTENVMAATVIFTNESVDYTSSYWDFGNGDNSTEDSPTHDYYEHNDFYVMLVVTNANGCTDTVQLLVENPLLQDLYVPNALYPGHSSYEVSHFLPKGIGLKEYHIQIYDDWGNLIWESNLLDSFGRPLEGWDGTYKGEPVQQDAYVWKISATFLDESVWEGKDYPNGKIKRAGTVTVIR